MIVSLIVAASRNGVIGVAGDLPWRLPEDMKFFKHTTTGHHVLMGRKTWESLPRALPHRVNLVLTRRPELVRDGATAIDSVAAALDFARQAGESELFVIGGQQVYEQTFHLAQRVYLTRVEAELQGDAFFPLDALAQGWEEVQRRSVEPDSRHAFGFAITQLERRRTPSSPH